MPVLEFGQIEWGRSELGCNGWNHGPRCDCGWGGDTGGGGWIDTPPTNHSLSAVMRRSSGMEWSGNFAPLFNSFVDPNAKCPVCGDPVFFYQSPDGGRVFFDQLGPPWPKHPCTDNVFRSVSNIVVERLPFLPGELEPERLQLPNQWQPLLHKGWREVGDYDVFSVDPTKFGFAGDQIVLTVSRFRNRPLYWRVNVGDPTLIDISSFDVGPDHNIREQVETVSSWIVDFDGSEILKISDITSPAVLYALACWVSFYWEGKVDNWHERSWVDLELAKNLFERASSAGHAKSRIALGRMHQKGLGVPVNPLTAFRMFNESAELRDGERAFHFIAECYRKGIGVERDEQQANHWKQRHMRTMREKRDAVIRIPFRGWPS